MATFIIRRLLLAVLTIWVLSALSFFIIQLPPGDYVDTYIIELIEGGFEKGSDGGGSEALKKTLRSQYGPDKPFYVQYAKWVWKILQGGFGQSLDFQKPVSEVIFERLLMTIILISKTALFAWGISIPVGIYSAVRQHSIEDYSITFIGFMGLPEWKLILKYPVWLALNQLVSTLG